MKYLKRVLSIVLALAIISLPLIVWMQRQELQDWYRLRDYTPPANVVALADVTTMNEATRRLFYVNHPNVADQATFNAACSQEASIVLGCYIPGKGIYLYNITDARLDGVLQVTAAHETLHAAYERLSTKEREHIDALTAQALKSITNQRLLDTVEKYRSQDPSVVPNELHSILGTEGRNLPPELETYYQRYFNNRAVLVNFSEQYENEFSKRQTQVADYDKQLEVTKQQIESNKQELALQYTALTAEKDRLDGLRVSGNIAEYNSGVSGFNSQVNSYNALVKKTDSMITTYNKLVITRNNVAIEVQGLAKAIDSRPQNF